jgi:isopentenyl diphosphate isomerase/L-lactate dehydrogenase-like FMN-dependent dehydrogenase
VTEPQHADYIREIYARGLGGEQPSIPIAVAELEAAAREAMDPNAVAYVYAGAGTEDTMRANREAFRRWRIEPRMLRDVAERDLSTSLLGLDMPAPIMLAPVGAQKINHPDGELATARAAAAHGVPIVASTVSAYSLEEIAEASDAGPRWFQLYWANDDEIARSMVERAEAAGYSAIVLTVDAYMLGWKPRDLQQAWAPFLHQIGIANYLADPVFLSRLDKSPEEDPGAAIGQFVQQFANPSLTWDRLEWLRSITSLPIVLKGILRVDDARRAAERELDGIVVSNHGGRQVDGSVASLDALPSIVEEVGDRMTVLFDSGVRSGADVFKALALGANTVLIGRPYIWGLALGGQEGVETVLRMLLAELDMTLALSGYTNPAELDRDALVRAPAPTPNLEGT